MSTVRFALGRLLWFTLRAPLFLLLSVLPSGRSALRVLSENVAIYIRWSTDEQTQGTTLDIQRDACRNQARAWQFGEIPDDRIFIDEGYSGGTLDRPAMTRLRELVKQGKINCVIVYKIDRLSRNIVDATSLVLREWDGRCHLKCVHDPVDTTTELGRLIFSILAMFADFERGQIRGRTVAGKLRRAGEGKNLTEAPYGYRRHGGTLAVVDHEATVVRHIFSLYMGGLGIQGICKRLASEGIRTRDGYLWGTSSVSRLLVNETYAGAHIYGKYRVGRDDESSRVLRESPLVELRENHPAIIEPAAWDAVQELRAGRAERVAAIGGRAVGSRHLLAGIAKCRCGAPFYSKQDRMGTWYYVCGKRRDKGACKCGWIPHDKIHGALLSQLDILKNDRAVSHLRAIVSGVGERELQELRTAISLEESRVVRLSQEIDKLDRDYRAGKLPESRYTRNVSAVESEQTEARERLQRLQADLVAVQEKADDSDAMADDITQLTIWNTLEIHQQRDLLHRLITSLVLYRSPGGGVFEADMHIKGVSLDFLSNHIDE